MKFCILFCLCLFTQKIVIAQAIGPGNHTKTISLATTVGILKRSYIVHVPPKYDSKIPTPVVLAFHYYGGDAEGMIRLTNLNKKADEKNFIVVYPNGTGRLGFLTFNGGDCCGYAMDKRIDDVDFTRILIDDLSRLVNVDQKRVFATGMSNGGIMSYLLASALSDKIAAIAPVGGVMATNGCNPTRSVSVIHFHGTADEWIPYNGGPGKEGGTFRSVNYSIQAWVEANGCNKTPTIKNYPDIARDGTTVTQATYGEGRDGSEVVLVTVHLGGHTWPGNSPIIRAFGKSTKDISANDLMWEFFEKHPMK